MSPPKYPPARELSVREVSSLMGGFLGSLSNLARSETIETALKMQSAPQQLALYKSLWDSQFQCCVSCGLTIPVDEEK